MSWFCCCCWALWVNFNIWVTVLQWNARFIKTTLMIVHLSFKTTLKIEINPLLFPCGRTGFWKPRQAWLSLVPTWIGDHYALGFVSAPGFLRGQFCVFVGFRDRCGRTLSQQRVPVRWGCSLSDWAWTLTGIIFTQLFPLFLSCSLLVSSSSKCVHGKQCWALAV